MVNDEIYCENVSRNPRKNRGWDLLLRRIRCCIAWCRDRINKAIRATLRKAQVNKDMPFQNDFKYAIHQKRFEIRKNLTLTTVESVNSESDDEAE